MLLKLVFIQIVSELLYKVRPVYPHKQEFQDVSAIHTLVPRKIYRSVCCFAEPEMTCISAKGFKLGFLPSIS